MTNESFILRSEVFTKYKTKIKLKMAGHRLTIPSDGADTTVLRQNTPPRSRKFRALP